MLWVTLKMEKQGFSYLYVFVYLLAMFIMTCSFNVIWLILTICFHGKIIYNYLRTVSVNWKVKFLFFVCFFKLNIHRYLDVNNYIIFFLFQLSWADLFFVGIIEYLKYRAEVDLLKDHPNLLALKEKVMAVPQIKSWVEKRPLSVDLK